MGTSLSRGLRRPESAKGCANLRSGVQSPALVRSRRLSAACGDLVGLAVDGVLAAGGSRGVARALVFLIVGAACNPERPVTHEQPVRNSGVASAGGADATAADTPVSILVFVVDGIVPVADAELLWVRDGAPTADGSRANRVEVRASTDAEGVARLRVPLATSNREYLGVWVRSEDAWLPVHVGACPAANTPFLCDLDGAAEQLSLVSAELRIVDAAERPVAGAAAEVLVDRRAGVDPTVPRCVAGVDGCLVLPSMLRPHAWVSVSAAGFVAIRMEPTWTAGAGSDTRRDRVELPRAHVVSVRYPGAAARDVLEVEFSSGGSEQAGAYAFSDGVARVSIPQGPATLIIRRMGHEIVRRQLDFSDGRDTVEIQ